MPLQVPNRIRAMRQERRFTGRRVTQGTIARALRTDAPRVSQMEAGFMLPNARELRAIATLLRCEVEDLYDGRWLTAIFEEERNATAPEVH